MATPPASTAPTRPGRIVCLGDSITEGNTYPALIQQALSDAKLEPPLMFNAGIGGDNAPGMLARLDRDVFVHKPDLIILDTGINDYASSADEYEATIDKIIQRCQEKHIAMILTTTSVLAPAHAAAEPHYAEFNQAIHRLAKKYGFAVAEVHERMLDAGPGAPLQEADGCHLNFAGYRLLTRAMLDALGYAAVPVPEHARLVPLPGLIRTWQLRVAPSDAAPAEQSLPHLKPDATWKTVRLPDANPVENWWMDSQRELGVAVALDQRVGPGAHQGVATFHSDRDRDAFVNTGAYVKTICLNGTIIYQNAPARGWHPGRDRIPVHLLAGDNVLTIEAGDAFFVAITNTDQW